MSKVLVFIFDGMTDYEITLITHLLGSDAGKEIITIAYEDKIIKSSSGLLYKPVRLVADVLHEDAEGLIICGAGTVFLAKAGVLKDVKYTTPIVEWTQKHIEVFGEKDPFSRENFVSKRVVRDGNVITAQGIAFIDFAIEICNWFDLFADQEDRDNFAKNIKGL